MSTPSKGINRSHNVPGVHDRTLAQAARALGVTENTARCLEERALQKIAEGLYREFMDHWIRRGKR